MFTGIVSEVGEVKRLDGNVLKIRTIDISKKVALGSSVSVSGVCLTVSAIEDTTLVFSVMIETFSKTKLGNLLEKSKVNLEGSLRAGDEVGAHFVYGHVDGLGEVVEVGSSGDDRLVSIKLPTDLMKYISPQGSVAVDGVSLTVASFDNDIFTVSLIPHTLEHTTLGDLLPGDQVNIEIDMLAKYVERVIINK